MHSSIRALVHCLWKGSRSLKLLTASRSCSRFAAYSTVSPLNNARTRRVRVPIGASGGVELDILEPAIPASKSPKAVLAYVPPGPFFPPSSVHIPLAPKHISTIPLFLASFLPNTTVITLNYRLSPLPSAQTFPLPIFDTLKAFDYITSSNSPHNGGHTPRVSIYASHIGGLLATTLALTEPKAIHTLAVSEPVVDWISLDEIEDEKQTKNSNIRRKTKLPASSVSLPDPTRLLSIRSKLFRSPETYFDAFASPILFLRAPGRDCPSDNSDPFLLNSPHSVSPTAQAFGPYDDDFDARRSTPSSCYQARKRRKVLRRWPPIPTDAVVPPYTRVYVRDTSSGEAGILRAQGEELVELMRRSCFYGREKGLAESRVQLQKMPDTSESEVEGIIGIKDAAMWLREKFEED